MAKSKGIKCRCGEVQFTALDDYKPKDSDTVLPVIVCDSCGAFYRKPKDFQDTNGLGY